MVCILCATASRSLTVSALLGQCLDRASRWVISNAHSRRITLSIGPWAPKSSPSEPPPQKPKSTLRVAGDGSHRDRSTSAIMAPRFAARTGYFRGPRVPPAAPARDLHEELLVVTLQQHERGWGDHQCLAQRRHAAAPEHRAERFEQTRNQQRDREGCPQCCDAFGVILRRTDHSLLSDANQTCLIDARAGNVNELLSFSRDAARSNLASPQTGRLKSFVSGRGKDFRSRLQVQSRKHCLLLSLRLSAPTSTGASISGG